ncbi:MAG: SpoIIE family protein phosphatase [Armatimonadota bacterium]
MKVCNNVLARKLVTFILAGTGIVLLLVMAFSYTAQKKQMLQLAGFESKTLTISMVAQIQASLAPVESIAEQTAILLGKNDMNSSASKEIIRMTLKAHPAVFGMAVALSEKTAATTDFAVLYGWHEGQNIPVTAYPSSAYQDDWFYLPTHLKKAVWVEPYYDSQSKTTMVTYAVPVMRNDEVIAVVTCDLSLKKIGELLRALPLGPGGLAVLLSRRGTFVSHPDHPDLEMKSTIFSLAEAQTDPAIAKGVNDLGHAMLSGKSGQIRYRRPWGKQVDVAYMYYATVPSTQWAIGIFRPENRVLAPMNNLNRQSAILGLLGLVLLLLPALFIARSVAMPLQRLASAANQLSKGKFDTILPEVHTNDEVECLTNSFSTMQVELRRYITELTATTAAKERIAGELSAAREIQMSIVPKLLPPFPDRPDIDLYAMLIPALEVGGDLYDFALLDDDHLYIAIGDVSGKGVPASLLMAVGKTLLKSTIQTVRAPARAMAHVNNELAEDNESCMFITMFACILNLKTGDFIYANAGHNPPLLVRKSGDVELLNDRPSPALGMCVGTSYTDHSRHMNTGDMLVLYTDGVTEAMNPNGDMYGDDGLMEFILKEGQRDARGLMESLSASVHSFAAGAAQSDDITALAVRYRADPKVTGHSSQPQAADDHTPFSTIELRNDLNEISRMAAWVEHQSGSLNLSPVMQMNLNLALEEWLVNVISYAFEDNSEHTIKLRLWHRQAKVVIEIEDDGCPFDPTAQADADTSLPLEHRQIGGLGIHFIRHTMDEFDYRRENDRNIVTMTKNINEEAR